MATNASLGPRRAGSNPPPFMVRVWDPLVRIGHWVLVLAFFIAYFTEDDLLTWHTWAGYTVAIVVLIRVIWGFIGPEQARFRDFVYRPSIALAYLRDLVLLRSQRYLGHSPGGGVMILALLAALAATTLTGMAVLAE